VLQKIFNLSPLTQVALQGPGSPGFETEYFGTLTALAAKKYQTIHGLISDGIVGPKTRAEIISDCTLQLSASTLPIPHTSSSPSSGSSRSSSSSSSTSGGGSSSTGGTSGGGTSSHDTTTPTVSTSSPINDSVISSPASTYPMHTNITAAVFWVGEPQGNGSSEDNAISAWDDTWEADYGGYDDYQNRNGYYPAGFIPKENPFYLDLPYNDFNDNGDRKSNALQVVSWASTQTWQDNESMMKNQWVKITKDGTTCYGQIEDSGPYQYNDYAYVFGINDPRPKSTTANNAGMDVSPALRDCLHFSGLNNVDNKVDWQFIKSTDVPNGPWKDIVTTSQINWP
jgi:hypothetical protein